MIRLKDFEFIDELDRLRRSIGAELVVWSVPPEALSNADKGKLARGNIEVENVRRELRELDLVDTSNPAAAVGSIPESLSELEGGSWWLLGGLLGLGALWWGLTRISGRT